MSSFQGSVKPKNKKRLRSGADWFDKSQAESQPATTCSSLLEEQDKIKSLEDEANSFKVIDAIVYLNEQKGKEKNRDMNKVLTNIDMKLEKIVTNLMAINDSL